MSNKEEIVIEELTGQPPVVGGDLPPRDDISSSHKSSKKEVLSFN